MLSKSEKTKLLDIIKKIDPKEMTIEHDNPEIVKWFRFGNYNALKIVSEVITNLPNKKAANENSVS